MVGREVDGQHVLSLRFVFYIFDRWSDVKLSGLCGVLGSLSGPLWVVLRRSWGLCGRPWAAPAAYVVGLGLS